MSLAVLTLPEVGTVLEDRRVQFIFEPVGRVVASLRNGHWDDPTAKVVRFGIADLLQTVQSFGNLPIYGWDFFDITDDENFTRWMDRLSLDWRNGTDGLSHTLD